MSIFIVIFAMTPSSLVLGNDLGAPHVDPSRGVRAQREAADKAKAAARQGVENIDAVIAALGDPSAAVRDAVFEAFLSWSPENLELLVGHLGKKSLPLVRENLVELLGRKRIAVAVPAILAQLSERKSPTLVAEAAHAIATWGPEIPQRDKVAAIVGKAAAKEKRNGWIKSELLRALHALDPEDLSPLREALNDKLLAPRILALRKLPDGDAIVGATAILADPPTDKEQLWGPRLLLTAVLRLRQVQQRELHTEALKSAIDALIGQLKDAEGRLRVEVGVVLRELTGQRDFPDEQLPWESWWKGKRESWTPADTSATGKTPRKGRTGVVRYHGLEIDSTRLGFLLDVSGGMSRNSAGEFNGKGTTRLDHCKSELIRTLEGLPAEVAVNITTFGSYYESCAPEPLPLGKVRKKLISFAKDCQVPQKTGHNRGNLYDTLIHACIEPQVDTLYLLSEGAPTEGKYLDYDRFIEHFERIYFYHPVRIHVISVGNASGSNAGFLRNLTRIGGGTLREIQTP